MKRTFKSIDHKQKLKVKKSSNLLEFKIKNEIVNLSFTDICDFTNLLNTLKNEVVEDAFSFVR